MTQEEIQKWKYNYQLNAYLYRGKFIDVFTHLERSIELYLTVFFFGNPNNQHEFKPIILDRLTFEAKRTAFRAILDKKQDESGFKKTKSNSYPHSKLIDEIRILNDHRIYFAHHELMIPFKPNDTIITLVEQRDKIKFIEYDLNKYNDLIKRIINTSNQINEMWRSLL